jgi:hypothetical protein
VKPRFGRNVHISVADEVSALILKAHASAVRDKATDIVDIWRCLEVCFAARVGPGEFANADARVAARRIRKLFADREGPGMQAMIVEQRLSSAAADERYTRITALIQRIIG